MLVNPEDFIDSLKQKDYNYINIIHKLAHFHINDNNPVYQIKLKNNEKAFIVDIGNMLYIYHI